MHVLLIVAAYYVHSISDCNSMLLHMHCSPGMVNNITLSGIQHLKHTIFFKEKLHIKLSVLSVYYYIKMPVIFFSTICIL